MKYSTYKHILLPIGVLTLITVMFIYYAPSEDVSSADPKRGCIASAYQSTRHAASTLEANLQVCDEL